MVTTRGKARIPNNDGSGSRPSLSHDLLLLIMMRVGLFDFIALSGVCKLWRSVALSNWSQIMVSKQPLYLSLSDGMDNKECYLEDHTKRKSKTMIPQSKGRVCVGLTCGYLMFYGRKTCDFLLVNPVTKKELHFPGFPLSARAIPTHIRGILVFSPSMSGLVFVVLAYRGSTELSFSLAGKQGKWSHISCNSNIRDVHFFKGKLYALNTVNQLFELRLSPVPTFTLQSSGEKFYAVDTSRDVDAIKVNFDERERINLGRPIGEYAVFVSDLKCDAAINPKTWSHPWTQYERRNHADGGDQSKKKGRCETTSMWYFPHECMNDIKNGALLNLLEE